jgi:hypothetical protein
VPSNLLLFLASCLIEPLLTCSNTKVTHNGIGGNVQFLDKKENNASSLPKKTAKVTAPAVESITDFNDDIPF